MINLLPPQYEGELAIEEKKRLVIILGIIFFLFLLSIILMLLAIRIYLVSQVEAQKSSLDLQKQEKETPKIKGIEDKIKIANQDLLLLDNFYQKQLSLSELLGKINDAIPSGLYLTNFLFSKDSSQIFLSGYSSTRENLKKFQTNLSQIFGKKDIKEINVPVANWIEAADVNFAGINFKISQ